MSDTPSTDITQRLRALYVEHGTNYVQEAAAEIERLRCALSDVTNERDALAKGVKITIPTNTMEQEFRIHYDRGYRAGRESLESEQSMSVLVPLDEYERGVAYAEEQRDALRALLEAATDARWPQTAEQMLPMNLARAALAKNPNPAGPFPATEASGTLATEASGAGGAGTDQRGSLPPRFKKGDGSFEDWYEGYFSGCTRPNGTITNMLRHAFEATRDSRHQSGKKSGECCAGCGKAYDDHHGYPPACYTTTDSPRFEFQVSNSAEKCQCGRWHRDCNYPLCELGAADLRTVAGKKS